MSRATRPNGRKKICDVPAATIRRIAGEYLEAASIGETIEIDGKTLPFRPVAVTLGKSVNNGWGAYECCWARTVLAALVGALENPGGTLGTTVRLNRPQDNRHLSVKPGEDGFMVQHFNPTGSNTWRLVPDDAQPALDAGADRRPQRRLEPGAGSDAARLDVAGEYAGRLDHAQADLSGILVRLSLEPGDLVLGDAPARRRRSAQFPFMVAFAYTVDETNYMADLLLPEATDLESTQLIRMGATKYMEHFWDYHGVVLRQDAVEPQGEARDFTWITTELARRTGLLPEYVAAINRGIAGVSPLKGKDYDFCLDPTTPPEPDEIWDAVCRAATTTLSEGKEKHGLDWYKEHGFYAVPTSRLGWYLTPTLAKQGLRYELPYQERLLRIGRELGNRLHEQNMHWWDEQLSEYVALPVGMTCPARWERALVNAGAQPEDFPFWLLTTKSMQYHSGGNAAIAMMDEVSENLRGTYRRHHQCRHGGETRHRGGRSRRGALACRRDLRQGIADEGHAARHARHRRPVRSLGDALRQGHGAGEPQHDRADVARTHRRHRLGRRYRARRRAPLDGEGRAHEQALCHGDRPAALRRLPDLHGRLQERQRHAAGRAMAPRARYRKRQISRRAPHLPAGRLHALRQSALHACLSDDRDEAARGRSRHHRLRPLHRLRQLHHGLPVRRALDRARAALRLRRADEIARPRASIPSACRSPPNAPSARTGSTWPPSPDRRPASIRTSRRPASIPAFPARCISATSTIPTAMFRSCSRETEHFRMHEELGTDPSVYYIWDGGERMSGPRKVRAIAFRLRRQTNWDARAAANFICGGAGGGLLLATALAATLGEEDLRPLVVFALALVGTGLTAVWSRSVARGARSTCSATRRHRG